MALVRYAAYDSGGGRCFGLVDVGGCSARFDDIEGTKAWDVRTFIHDESLGIGTVAGTIRRREEIDLLLYDVHL
jgi:hypothetical protein